MRSLVLRVLGLWFALIIVTSVAVLVVRADPESPTLKAVGLSLCEGAPCFRGLTVGSSWEEALRRFPKSSSDGSSRELPMDIADVRAKIWPSDDGKTVKHILLMMYNQVQITAGEIVARYGTPCLLFMTPTTALLIYPELIVNVDIMIGNPNVGTAKYQLQLTSPGFQLAMSPDSKFSITCSSPVDEYTGRWQGFISPDLYLSRFRSNQEK
jgi:hypothetical protein